MDQERRMEKEDLKIVNKGLEDEMVSQLVVCYSVQILQIFTWQISETVLK